MLPLVVWARVNLAEVPISGVNEMEGSLITRSRRLKKAIVKTIKKDLVFND